MLDKKWICKKSRPDTAKPLAFLKSASKTTSEASNSLQTSKISQTSAIKHTLSVREVWDSILEPAKSEQRLQRLATVAPFLRSCAVQALSLGDGHRRLVTRFGVIWRSIMKI